MKTVIVMFVMISLKSEAAHIIRVSYHRGDFNIYQIINLKNFQKRQIFREQVLEHKGGKIPDSAFLVFFSFAF